MTVDRTARVQSLKAIQGTLEWLKTGSVCALAAQDSGHPSYNHSLKIHLWCCIQTSLQFTAKAFTSQ